MEITSHLSLHTHNDKQEKASPSRLNSMAANTEAFLVDEFFGGESTFYTYQQILIY